MNFTAISSITPREPIPGFTLRIIHGERMSLAWWDIKAGSVLPEHSHPHEQVAECVAGEFELVVAGEARVLRAGDTVVIPGDVRHSGRAVTDCKMFDVFAPAREDLKAK